MRFRSIVIAGVLALIAGACTPASKQKPRYIWIEAPANFFFYANSETSIENDCRKLAQAGFTDIVVDVRPTSGDVLFRSSVAPPLRKVAKWSDDALRYVNRTGDFDYLEAFIRSGHAAGLRVHAAVNMMVGGFCCDSGDDTGMLYENPQLRSWAAVDNTPDGLMNQLDDITHEGGRFLDPANPEVQEFLLTMLGDLAAYEGLDGIVMDRCRYDDAAMDAGYTEVAYKLFSEYIGHEPERWPVIAEPGHIFLDWEPDTLDVQWLTFRCQVIHDFVARAAQRVHSVAPDLQFANYVGAWFSEYYRSGVNWTSPNYPLTQEEPTYGWATEAYQKTGIAPLVDLLILGTYTGAGNVHGDVEKTMEGYARLGRKRLCGDVPFIAGPDLGNEPGFNEGNQHEVIPEIIRTLDPLTDGLFFFDLCHVRLYDYWGCFKF